MIGIVCSALINPTNGRILYGDSDFGLGVNATYKCTIGFGLSDGSTVRECTGNSSSFIGEWTGVEPNCEG